MSTRYIFMAGVVAALISSAGTVQALDGSFKTTITGVSDYRYRGMSQTFRDPAIQAGTEYSMDNGIYLGAWASNVSDNQYPGGNKELDLYGGYRWTAFTTSDGNALNADIGVLNYRYPGANYDEFSPPVADEKFDTVEIYGSLNYANHYGSFTGKLSAATTDYFGINSKTASSYGNGHSDGSVYLSLDYSVPLHKNLSLVAHAGHTWVRNYHALNYLDYKLGVTAELAGFTIEVSGIETAALSNQGESFNTYTDGNDTSRVYKPAVVLSVSRAF